MPDAFEKITEQLRRRVDGDPNALQRVVIVVNTQSTSLGAAFDQVAALVKKVLEEADRTEQHILSLGDDMHPYVTARLQGKVLQTLVALDAGVAPPSGPVISVIRSDVDDGKYFNPDNMIRSVISVPLLNRIDADADMTQHVMIEVNFTYSQGRTAAKQAVRDKVVEAVKQTDGDPKRQFVIGWKSAATDQYLYATLTGRTIRKLVELDQQRGSDDKAEPHAIYHIWPDFKVRAQVWKSVSTIKADACRRSFATTGRGIVWAVLDSGIDASHLHFQKHQNLVLPGGLSHMDFTGAELIPLEIGQLTDEYGHGTHVAGIIAGELMPASRQNRFSAKKMRREESPTERKTLPFQ
jgi:subtilisin family serine protease